MISSVLVRFVLSKDYDSNIIVSIAGSPGNAQVLKSVISIVLVLISTLRDCFTVFITSILIKFDLLVQTHINLLVRDAFTVLSHVTPTEFLIEQGTETNIIKINCTCMCYT